MAASVQQTPKISSSQPNPDSTLLEVHNQEMQRDENQKSDCRKTSHRQTTSLLFLAVDLYSDLDRMCRSELCTTVGVKHTCRLKSVTSSSPVFVYVAVMSVMAGFPAGFANASATRQPCCCHAVMLGKETGVGAGVTDGGAVDDACGVCADMGAGGRVGEPRREASGS